MGAVTTSGIKDAGLSDGGLMGNLRTDVRPTDEIPMYQQKLTQLPLDPRIDVPSRTDFGVNAARYEPAPAAVTAPNFVMSPGTRIRARACCRMSRIRNLTAAVRPTRS